MKSEGELLWTMGWNSEVLWTCWPFSNLNPYQTAAEKKASRDFWSFCPLPWVRDRFHHDFTKPGFIRHAADAARAGELSTSAPEAQLWLTLAHSKPSFQRNKLYLYLAWKRAVVCNREKIHFIFCMTHYICNYRLIDAPILRFSRQRQRARCDETRGETRRRLTSVWFIASFSMTVFVRSCID